MRSAFVLLASLLAIGAQPAPPPFPIVLTIPGTLTYADYERHIEHGFDVPPGTRRVEVTVSATGAERRTVLDLGLRDPDGLRGWSGGRTDNVSVSRLSAAPGYLPGAITPGRWAVLIGIPNIRAGSEDTYTLTVRLSDDERGPPGPALAGGPRWFVGDLHMHSGHSDGRVTGEEAISIPAPVHEVLQAASRASLDFAVLSDHNTASHWLDVDRLQPRFPRMLLLHGREVTTYRGHANTAGERRFAEFRLARPDDSPADVLTPIASDGAFVSINHPAAPDDERCMGCGWSDFGQAVRGSVHGIEVVNGDARSGPLYGWPLWARLLNEGWRLTAVGGSDEHTPDEHADRVIGTPATVVWARELSEPAIVEGLKSGRVYVRTRGPNGPSLEFGASVGERHVTMGDVVAPAGISSLRLRATVTGAAGQSLEWVRNGDVFARREIVDGVTVEQASPMRSGHWFSVVVRAGDDPTLLSNAIYIRDR